MRVEHGSSVCDTASCFNNTPLRRHDASYRSARKQAQSVSHGARDNKRLEAKSATEARLRGGLSHSAAEPSQTPPHCGAAALFSALGACVRINTVDISASAWVPLYRAPIVRAQTPPKASCSSSPHYSGVQGRAQATRLGSHVHYNCAKPALGQG